MVGIDQGPVEVPKNFWSENARKIRAFRQIIEEPHTPVGKTTLETLKYSRQAPTLQDYPRLVPIVGSFIAMAECQAMSRHQQLYLFSNEAIQRAVVKAVSMKVEEDIQKPYHKHEPKTYNHYRPFMENFIARCQLMENEIIEKGKSTDIVRDLFTALSESIPSDMAQEFKLNKEVLEESLLDSMPSFQIRKGGNNYKELLKALLSFYHFI